MFNFLRKALGLRDRGGLTEAERQEGIRRGEDLKKQVQAVPAKPKKKVKVKWVRAFGFSRNITRLGRRQSVRIRPGTDSKVMRPVRRVWGTLGRMA